MNKIDPVDIGYLAGLIDGEGCIYMQRNRSNKGKYCSTCIGLQIGMTEPAAAVRWAYSVVGTGNTYGDTKGRAEKGEKSQLVWTVSKSEDLEDILVAVLPHLKVKNGQAELALDYIQWRRLQGRWIGEDRQEIVENYYWAFRELNRKGVRKEPTAPYRYKRVPVEDFASKAASGASLSVDPSWTVPDGELNA